MDASILLLNDGECKEDKVVVEELSSLLNTGPAVQVYFFREMFETLTLF